MKSVWILFWRHLKPALTSPSRMMGLTARILSLLKSRGLHGTLRKFSHRQQLYDEYPRWVALYDTVSDQELAHMRTRMAELPVLPRFSFLIPAMAGEQTNSCPSEQSLSDQIYPHWELHRLESNPDGFKCALAAANGEWVALLEPVCKIPPHALLWIAEELSAHPEAEIIYVDEDSIDANGNRYAPNFKPDWNPDLLLSHNYLGSLVFYRRERIMKLGGLRAETQSTMAWEVALHLTDGMRPSQILHIPHVLCHRHSPPVPDSNAERRVLEKYLHSKHWRASVTPGHNGYWRIRHALPVPPPLVSIIIPTRNGLSLLERCISSILDKTCYTPYEIIVVDNQSNDRPTLDYLRKLENNATVRVLSHDTPFNYSTINNLAAARAKGTFLCLLNNDIETIHPEWLEEMTSQAARPGAGAVGAMLYYPNGSIQHAGVLLKGREVATHFFARMPASLLKTRPRAQMVQNLSAVTAACLVIEKKKYFEVGGFDANLAVTCNDIDLCLKLRKAGYNNIWTPFAQLYHHESATRGFDDNPARQARIRQERAYMYQRWATVLDHDPAYNPNLDLEAESYALAFPPRFPAPDTESSPEAHARKRPKIEL